MLTDDVREGAARILRERLRESVAKAVPVPTRPEDIAHLRDAAIDLMLDSLDAHGKVLSLTLQVDSLRTEVDEALVQEKARADKAEADLQDEIAIRDDYHEWADRITAAVAGGQADLGEHSSTNNPWRNAIERAEHLNSEVRRLGAGLITAQHEADRLRASKETERSRSKSQLQRLNEQIHVLRLTNEDLARVNHEHVATIRDLQRRQPDDTPRAADGGTKPTITIPEPRVPYPGGRSQTEFMRTASARIETSRLFGSNLTATVAKALADIADALEAKETDKEPSDG